MYEMRNQMVLSKRDFTLESLDKLIQDLKEIDN